MPPASRLVLRFLNVITPSQGGRAKKKKKNPAFGDFFKCLFILRKRERERERECISRGEGKKRGERENPKQALHCQHGSQCRA